MEDIQGGAPFRGKRVVGIGDTVLDILFKDDRPLAAVPGGSTFNSIVSLGKAGVPCAMVTEVGGDHVGDLTCRYLRDNGVSTDYVHRRVNSKSYLSLAFLDDSNDAQYLFYKDHARMSLDGALPGMAAGDVLLFGSFFSVDPAVRHIVGTFLKDARRAGAWLYYDVNFRRSHIPDLPHVLGNVEENIQLADVVRGSVEDFANLFGMDDADAIYGRVGGGSRTFILTDGARPVRVYTPRGRWTFPVQAGPTVSTVGAGDNFNAGYIYAAMQGHPDQASRIRMAMLWSQDVCRQAGNTIGDDLAARLRRDAGR